MEGGGGLQSWALAEGSVRGARMCSGRGAWQEPGRWLHVHVWTLVCGTAACPRSGEHCILQAEHPQTLTDPSTSPCSTDIPVVRMWKLRHREGCDPLARVAARRLYPGVHYWEIRAPHHVQSPQLEQSLLLSQPCMSPSGRLLGGTIGSVCLGHPPAISPGVVPPVARELGWEAAPCGMCPSPRGIGLAGQRSPLKAVAREESPAEPLRWKIMGQKCHSANQA